MNSILNSLRGCHNNLKKNISLELQCYEHNTKQSEYFGAPYNISTAFQRRRPVSMVESTKYKTSTLTSSRRLCFITLEGGGYKLYGAPQHLFCVMFITLLFK